MPRRPVLYTSWTKGRTLAFLEHLAISSNVAASERVARMSAGSAYRRRQKDADFDRAWLVALRQGYAQLEHAMLARALKGVAVVRTDKHGVRTETTEFSDRVALTLLNAHRATVTQAAPIADGKAAKARLIAKLTDMRARMADEG